MCVCIQITLSLLQEEPEDVEDDLDSPLKKGGAASAVTPGGDDRYQGDDDLIGVDFEFVGETEECRGTRYKIFIHSIQKCIQYQMQRITWSIFVGV